MFQIITVFVIVFVLSVILINDSSFILELGIIWAI